MSSFARRTGTVVGGTAAIVLLAAGPASAHFCYLLNASDRSDANRAGSNGWTAFSDIAQREIDGMCYDGAVVLAKAAGVSPGTPILDHSTLANGTLRNGKGKDVPAVGHLDFGKIELAMEEAFAAC